MQERLMSIHFTYDSGMYSLDIYSDVPKGYSFLTSQSIKGQGLCCAIDSCF